MLLFKEWLDYKNNIHVGLRHVSKTYFIVGYPVINDSLYNSDIWGPNKGKGGNFNITGDEVYCM